MEFKTDTNMGTYSLKRI